MLTKIKAWIDKHDMLKSGDNIVVACSGGPDSLALLHIFNDFRLKYNINLFAAHVDHMFRGQESAQEALFVLDFCREHQISCYHTAIDVPAVMKETGLSGQEAARMVRYQYLQDIAATLGNAKIATGHHLDDQAETVLINILRGAGSTGIRGIRPVNGNLIRPLLCVDKAELAIYCQEWNLEPRFDSSNLKTNYLRNRVRITLLPQLETQYNSSIRDVLCRTATLVGDEHDFIQTTACTLWNDIVTEEAQTLFISLEKMRAVHVAVQREIFRMSIEKKRGSLTGISFHHVETLLQTLFDGRVGSILQLPGNIVASKQYEGLYLGREEDFTAKAPNTYSGQVIAIPGITFVPELGIRIEAKLTEQMPKERSLAIAVFDWDKISSPIVVRTRLKGDRFQPSGFQGNKKLKEFLIDEKILRSNRDLIPIICDAHHIIWVSGYRQAEVGRVTKDTKQFLVITVIEM